MASNVTQRIYELQVKLAASSLAALKKLQAEANETNKKLDGLNKVGGDLLKGFLAGFTIDAFIQGVSGAIGYVDDLAATAEKLGVIGTESFSALAFAAEQSDVSMGALQNGIKQLQKSINDVGSKGNNILEALGIDTAGKDIEEVLGQFADQFNKIQDPVQQTNALLKVFGRQGLELRPLLNQGSAGIEELTNKARELGLTVGDETAGKLGDLDNAMLQLQAQTRGLFIDIAEGLAPSLLRVAENFEKTGDQGEKFKTVGAAIGKVFEGITLAGMGVITSLEVIGKTLGAIAAAAAELASGETERAWQILTENSDAAGVSFQKLADDAIALTTEQAKQEEQTKETGDAQELTTEQTKALTTALQGETKATKAQVSEGAKRLEQMGEQLAKMQLRGALDTEYFALLGEIERGTLKVSEAERDRLLAMAEQIDAENELIAAEEKFNKTMEDGAAVTEAMRTPLEVYSDETARLVGLLNDGAISQETFNRAVSKSYDDMTRANEAAAKSNDELEGTDKLLDELGGKVDGYAKEISGALVSFATGAGDAKLSFSDMVTSILADLAQMVTQVLVVEPLIESLKNSLAGVGKSGGSSGGGGGGWMEIIGAIAGSFFGSANGNVFNGGQLVPFAKGGIVSGPTIFPMAKGAGLMGEAGPEAVMPLARDAQGRLGVSTEGAGLQVNIYNQAGAEVTTETQTGPSGERILNVTIVKAVEQAINTGRLDSTFNNAFGLSRRGR